MLGFASVRFPALLPPQFNGLARVSVQRLHAHGGAMGLQDICAEDSRTERRLRRRAALRMKHGSARFSSERSARRTFTLHKTSKFCALMVFALAVRPPAGKQQIAVALEVDSRIDAPEDPNSLSSELLVRRARSSLQEGSEDSVRRAVEDFSKVIEEDDLQPFARLFRADAFMLLRDYTAAALDYSAAVTQFTSIKDDASAEAARAGWALALFGEGKQDAAITMIEKVILRASGVNAEIELLLPLARREVELRVALAAIAWSQGKQAQAEGAWESACLLSSAVEEFVLDGQRDPQKELLFRETYFPGSQSIKASKRRLLIFQARRPYDNALPRIGAENTNIQTSNRESHGCRGYRDRAWVEKNKGWPPVLLDMLGDFFRAA